MFPFSCEDPLVKTLREVFGANIVRVPEQRIQPLGAVAYRDGVSAYLGPLENLLVASGSPVTSTAQIEDSRMANISGRKTREVDFNLGMKILDGFLGAFGVPSAGVQAALKGATSVTFSFQDVWRRFVHIGWLGRILSGQAIARANPSAAIFFREKPYVLLVIDSVIQSSDFTLSVEKSSTQNFKIDVPLIEQVLAKASVQLNVQSASGKELSFKGAERLTFAFSCVQFYINAGGQIDAVEPEFKTFLLSRRADLGGLGQSVLQYTPDRVLLAEQPGMHDMIDPDKAP